jgi:hypothetical protein
MWVENPRNLNERKMVLPDDPNQNDIQNLFLPTLRTANIHRLISTDHIDILLPPPFKHHLFSFKDFLFGSIWKLDHPA